MKSLNAQVKFYEAHKLHQDGEIEAAKKLYEEILITEPDQPKVLYNLALALIFLNQIDKAREILEKVLLLNPGHFDALNNLGALLLKQNQEEQALQCFSSVLAGKPDHLEARNNLASTLLQLGRYYHAAEHFKYYLEKLPEDIGARYGYALALLDSNHFDQAIMEFEKILLAQPDHLNAQSNLGIAYLKSGSLEKAKIIFNQVLHKKPDSPEIKYLYSALLQENMPDKPPKEYIENLFDHYAKYYESHMVDNLNYKVPDLLFNLFNKYVSPQQFSILDLGCGSGLSGLVFKKIASNLTGIDLSDKMLDLAKHKLIYDKLVQDDINNYLKNINKKYDLLVAADTFNYFGDLNSLFYDCYQVLKPNGYLLFSLEKTDGAKEWVLEPSSRYGHARSYIEKVAKNNYFKIITLEESELRVQNHVPVRGWICLLSI